MQSFLIIQTAFIGDAILATAVLEKLHRDFPDAALDVLVRKGNESLFKDHPFIRNVIVWDKSHNKYAGLMKLIKNVRRNQYDYVINLQRFVATGLLTALSGSKNRIGFDKNPMSRFFDVRVPHYVAATGEPAVHETERNLQLIAHLGNPASALPRLYPSAKDVASVADLQSSPYICIAPTSVWFSKQLPAAQWQKFISSIPEKYVVYLLGSKADNVACDQIKENVTRQDVHNLASKLSLLQSAALMKNAAMNYVNDSAPLHMASAIDAPVTAVYCSTIPEFGFGPLSTKKFVIESMPRPACKPCGLHGFNKCPLGHFNCAVQLKTESLLATIPL